MPDRPIAVFEPQCFVPVPAQMYNHACQHGELGPFQQVEALSNATLTKAVNGGGRILAVNLPGPTSYMRYRATRQGQHAIFSGSAGAGVEVQMFFNDEPLPKNDIEPVAADLPCGELSWVTGFVLQQDMDYVVEIGPTRFQDVKLFIESVETFGAQDWSASCDQ